MRSERPLRVLPLLLAAAFALAACSGGAPRQPSGEGGHYKPLRPYEIRGRWYEPYYDPSYRAVGVASWYGDPFHGRLTANGERYDKRLLSAAHTTLPLPSVVEVTNLENGRSVQVRVNDRGPFVGDRVIDLSEAAAEELGFKRQGLARVEVRFLRLANASGTPPEPTARRARANARERPTANAAPNVAASAPGACDGLYVDVGVFPNGAEAQVVALALSRRVPAPGRGHAWHEGSRARVSVGPFADVDSAHRALAIIVRDGYPAARILHSGASGDCRPRSA